MTPTPVSFSQGARLVGRLFGPAGRATGPGVLVTGSWLTVKEQMPAVYAARLAEAGFTALTFDFRGFGESDGPARDVESAAAKVEDLRSAAAFLAGWPGVEGRVAALGICASAGYLAQAVTGDPAVRTVAMVAPWLHDAALVREIYGGEAGVAERLKAARAARAHHARTGEVRHVPAASATDATAAMYWPGDALDYYLNPRRGAVPQWSNRFAVMAWTEWLGFDPVALAPQVKVPVRLITGPGTATPGGAARFAAGLTVPHDVVSLPGTQFHFYDDPATVTAATAAAVAHLRATL
ncbi:MAG: alpha/beta fold hydrolase [Anaeromyxobacter sp.]